VNKDFVSKDIQLCSSLGLYDIDGHSFVVRCQNLPKYQCNILHSEVCKIARNFGATFPIFLRNFCHKFSATFDFLSTTFCVD